MNQDKDTYPFERVNTNSVVIIHNSCDVRRSSIVLGKAISETFIPASALLFSRMGY